MRLKQDQKFEIVSKLVAVTFKDRVERKVAEENRLAVAVLNTKITPAQREAMDALPATFFARGSYLYVSAQRDGRSNLHVRLDPPADLRIPYFLNNKTVVLEDEALLSGDEKTLLAEIDDFIESNKNLNAERSAFEQQAIGVVNSFSTSQKLIEAWPVVAEIMPADYFAEPAKPQLPTTKINELDVLVQGARPFETETVAA